MKITWFSGMTLRIHIGGRIVVTDPAAAPGSIDPAELTAGADTLITPGDDAVPAFDAARWRPRKARSLIDIEPGDEGIDLYRLPARSLVVDAVGEPPVVLCDAADSMPWNRWADGAVVVLCGSAAACAAEARAALAIARPRLIALAVQADADTAFEAVAPDLSGAALVVLEPGLAVEV